MLHKISSLLVVGVMVFGQPITVLANTIDSELQTNNAVSEEHEEISDELEESSESTLDEAVENVGDSDLTVASTSEESTPPSSTKTETSSSEASKNSEEIEEDTLAEDIVTGTWGSVPWEWNSETATLTLKGGNAGTVATAPWRTFRDVVTIIVEDRVTLPSSSQYLFKASSGTGADSGLRSLVEIRNGNNLDTSKVTSMQWMFHNASSLETIDVSNWDVSSVRDMGVMFEGTSLKELDVSKWDTSSVTTFVRMFSGVSSLVELDVSQWDTANVSSLQSTFANMTSLARLDVSNWNVSNVSTFNNMFLNTASLLELDLSGWHLDRATNINSIFSGMSSLAKLNVSNWDVSRVTNMQGAFSGVSSIEELDLSSWDTRRATSSGVSMFEQTRSLKKLELGPNTTFLQVAVNLRPRLPERVMPTDTFTGNWIYQRDSEGNIPGEQIILTPTELLQVYDGSKPGIYVWEIKKASPVTVHYTDMSGEQLLEPVILDGEIGLPYESEAKEIPGWYVVETPENASGTFTEEAQEVVYVYDRSDAAPVTIRYVDTEGNQLSEPTVLNGKVGLSYESEAKEITGWYVSETPSNAHGTFREEAQEVVYVYDRSDAAPVTVKYQDSEGNQLSEPSILSGKVGLPYESEAKEIPGWYVVETPENTSGTFTEEAQEVVYVYNRSDAAPVTVKYQDSEGNQLSEPSILSGKVGLPYESEVKEIPGWYVSETPSNAHGTFREEAQEVVYVYDRSDAAPVTVKYQDSEGNQLSEPSILSGKVGLPYESEAKEIPGWYVSETPSNAHGTFSEEAQEVVYVYNRSDAAPVTVRYQDFEGNQLSEPSILSGKVGLPYESEAKEIPGWYVVETPENAHGTFSEEAQEVVYVYNRSDAAPVTVKYQDSEGNQLSEPSILSGKVGLPYESEAKEIRGWYVAETPENASGTFTEKAQEVVYVYNRSDAAPVTVKYQDSEGNQLSEPSILSGKVGLPYESEAKEIPGWYVVETPENASGTFTEEAQEMVYVYDRSDAAPITIRYVDTEGNQLSEPSVLSGKIGLPYESEAKEIRGWYVVETPENASGTFTEEAQEVVYVYDRSDAAPITIRYVDTEGNQLSEPSVLSGKIGLPYESEAKEIRGWYVVETPENASGAFTEEAQEVVYVYNRSDAAPVTVKYQDSEGNQLSEPSILSGKVGLPYESEAKEIRGWYVAETPENASGTFTEEAQEVVYVYNRSDAAPVTVKYQDTEGNQLSEPSILSGKVGLPYESEAKEIRGWYVAETPENTSGTFTEEAQEVVYVYNRSDAAPVTVKYQDTEGNQLSEPSILSGKVGLPYESEAKEIRGWYVMETPKNASGTFTEEAQEVVYVYDRSDAAPVTVRYQDSEGNQLSEPSILSGKVGLPYESEAKEIPGWYVVETPENASGTFTEEAQEAVYVYDRSDATPVTVRYQDSEGNQLSEPSILSGKVGLPYESEAKEIRGWYVVETPENASGTFTEKAQEVVYVYNRSDAAPVTVKYQDSEGNQLSEPSILSGKVGLPYESEAKEIPGWYVVETPENTSGTFTEEAQEVVYVYNRSDAAPVTVRYQDSEGNQLSEPSILSGKVGLPYESEAKEIPGWYVVETPENASGTFTEEAQEVVYVYNRSNAAPVTIRYVDPEGNQLSEPSILSGKIGLPYESEAREIPSWHVVSIPDNASGRFTANPQEVVYIYAINKNDSEKDNSDNKVPKDNNFSDTNKRLPKTGESLIGQLLMVSAGSIIIMGVFVFVVKKRKKNKE